MKRNLLRIQEDNKYKTILTARICEDDHIRKVRAAEDKGFDRIKHLFQDDDLVGSFNDEREADNKTGCLSALPT